MKRTGIDHPKTKRLAKLLGVPHFSAVGVLECLWHFAARHAIRGDIGRWSNAEIADAIGWPAEDAERLIAAVVDAGWLDHCQSHRLVVHDWPDHCDESVRKTIKKHGWQFVLPCLTPSVRESFATVPESFANGREQFSTVPDSQSQSQSQSRSESQSQSQSQAKAASSAAGVVLPAKASKVKDTGKAQEPIPIPAELDTPEFAQAWAEWKEHLRQKRKPMKPLQEDKLLSTWAANGVERTIAAINHSIANGWQGLFEPNAPNNGQRPAAMSQNDPRGNFAALAEYRRMKAAAGIGGQERDAQVD